MSEESPAPEAAKPPESAPPKPETKAEKAAPPKGKRRGVEAKAPKPREKKAEKKKGEAPKPAAPAPFDAVKASLVRFVAVRARERYPESRRMLPGPVRALARSRIEEHPEVLESYRKNRRRGEQEALPIAHALAGELAGRAPAEEAED